MTRNIISCTIPYGPDPPLVYFPATTAKYAVLIRVNGNVENARRELDNGVELNSPARISKRSIPWISLSR